MLVYSLMKNIHKKVEGVYQIYKEYTDVHFCVQMHHTVFVVAHLRLCTSNHYTGIGSAVFICSSP